MTPTDETLIADYARGNSLPLIVSRYRLSYLYVRRIMEAAGVLRTRAEAVALSGSQGRLGRGIRKKQERELRGWIA